MREEPVEGVLVLRFLKRDVSNDWVLAESFEIQLLSHNVSKGGADHIDEAVELLLLDLCGGGRQEEVLHSSLDLLINAQVLHGGDHPVHHLVHPRLLHLEIIDVHRHLSEHVGMQYLSSQH